MYHDVTEVMFILTILLFVK